MAAYGLRHGRRITPCSPHSRHFSLQDIIMIAQGVVFRTPTYNLRVSVILQGMGIARSAYIRLHV